MKNLIPPKILAVWEFKSLKQQKKLRFWNSKPQKNNYGFRLNYRKKNLQLEQISKKRENLGSFLNLIFFLDINKNFGLLEDPLFCPSSVSAIQIIENNKC